MTENSTFNLNIDGQSTLQPAIKGWEMFLNDQGRSQYTIRSFLGDLNLLSSYLPPDKTISEITTNDLNRFLEWLKEGRGRNIPCSPKSYSRRITSIKSFFRWLHKHTTIVTDPAESILQHSVISPLPDILTPLEEEIVLDAAAKMQFTEKPDLRPYLLVKLLLETGIKKSECINIKLNHIDIELKEPFIFIRYSNLKDRNKERKVQVSNQWVEALKKYINQKPLEDTLFPWSPRRLEYILEDLGKAANLNKHLSFSMCRWTCAMNDMRKEIDADTIRQKIGVSKIQWREIKMKLNQLAKTGS
jgi:site-specific recombinase XerD